MEAACVIETLDISVLLCQYGVLGSFSVAFRAGAGRNGEGSDDFGLEAQEEGGLVGVGAVLRPQLGDRHGVPRLGWSRNLCGSVGQRLLPSVLTSPWGGLSPAVMSPIASPTLPPGSANS